MDNENVFHWYKHTDSFKITQPNCMDLAYEKEYSQNHREKKVEYKSYLKAMEWILGYLVCNGFGSKLRTYPPSVQQINQELFHQKHTI